MTIGNYTSITVTNTIPSGAAFAIKHGTGESCYIPASVTYTSNVRPGDVVQAILVDNPNDDVKHKTPYMVRFIKAEQLDLPLGPVTPTTPPAPMFNAKDVEDFVRSRMKEGGVWTVSSMFQDYMNDDEAKREDNAQAYNAVSTSLRKMFDNDECAKWSMWTKASQSKVGREWFSCYPQNVEVAEWEDE
jgi:hypothetical protein